MADAAENLPIPSDRQKQYVDTVCAAIATGNKGITRLCNAFRKEDQDFPAASTIMLWFTIFPQLSEQYAQAKRHQAEFLAQEIIDIADDDSQDEIFTDEGNRIENREFVNRSKLRVDARKWIACKLLPKVYGDRQIVEHDISDNLALQLQGARERVKAITVQAVPVAIEVESGE